MTTTDGKPTALYARYSTDLQNDRSITDQFAYCKRQYADRNGLNIVSTHHDAAKTSATLFDRDGLLDLMRQAKEGRFQAILAEALDRISSDPEDLHSIHKRLNFYGVELHTVAEGRVNEMHIAFKGLVGQQRLEIVKRTIRRNHSQKASEGRVPGSLTYGYARVLGKPGERVIEPTQADVVRRIFSEYADGRSVRTIAADLTREGVKPPKGAAMWNHQTFIGGGLKRGMISNEIYAGRLVWNRSRQVMNPETGRKIKRAAPVEDLVVADVPHLRIIDQDLFDRANALRRERSIAKFGPGGMTRRPVVPRGEYLLAGLMLCGTCNGRMRISGSHRVSCATAHQFGTCGHRRTYELKRVQALLIDHMKEKLLDPEREKRMAVEYAREMAEQRKQNQRSRADAEKRLAKLEFQIKRLVDAMLEDDSQPVAYFKERLAPLEQERATLAGRLGQLQAEQNVVELHPSYLDEYRRSVEELHAALSTGDPDTGENRARLRKLIASVVIHPTERRAPYEISAYGQLAAILGVPDVFPDKSERLVSNFDNGNTLKTELPPFARAGRTYPSSLTCLPTHNVAPRKD